MNPFVDRLATSGGLRDIEIAILRDADVRNAEELHSLLVAFPGLADAGVDLPRLSAMAAGQAVPSYMAVASFTALSAPKVVEFGALPPPEVSYAPGATLPVPSLATTGPAPATPVVGGSRVDHRLPGWPVRNQASRGTCVAHGLAACVEQLVGGGDLSEQFLYWAIKDHHDPNAYQDGTWLHYAAAALQHDGICPEATWPYNGAAVAGHKGDPPPPYNAVAAAAPNAKSATHWRNGSAAAIHAALVSRPLAISLPVFGSPSQPNVTNWTSLSGWATGRVLNPPGTAVTVGGHCVCVTGFEPDANEPGGGWFIIRNSWDTAWGTQGTPANPLCPQPGYGSVSATYVDTYTWEWCQL